MPKVPLAAQKPFSEIGSLNEMEKKELGDYPALIGYAPALAFILLF